MVPRNTFYRPVNKRSKAAMRAFLTQHFRYFTGNSWNVSSSYACNMKLYHLGLPRELEDKLWDMLEVEEFYDPINQLRRQFAEEHDYQWQAAFNGRSGGYLVLYQGGRKPTGHKSYCTCCGQRNFTSVTETNNVCGRCGQHTRVDYTRPPMEVYAYPMRGVDSGEDYEDWSLSELRERTTLVQEFDRLADAIVSAGIKTAETHEVTEEIFYKPVSKKCFA